MTEGVHCHENRHSRCRSLRNGVRCPFSTSWGRRDADRSWSTRRILAGTRSDITGLVDFTVPVHVVTDPQQVHAADVLMVTVKTYDMASALQSVKHIDVGSVLSIQNGVLKNEQLAQTFGWEKVLGATAMFTAEVLPIGTVRFTANQGFYLGELPAGTSARVQTLGETLERVGIVAHVTPSMQSLEWSKYVAWMCCMAPAVLTHLETYKFLQEAHTACIVAAMVREITQLATTQGITLEDMAFFPIRTLSQLALDDMVTHVRQIGERFASLAPTQKMLTFPIRDFSEYSCISPVYTL
jgi:2-dehydropantoate 2-reductase